MDERRINYLISNLILAMIFLLPSCMKNTVSNMNEIIGIYETKDNDNSKRFYPSEISIKPDYTFTMYVNLCSEFGTVKGKWQLDQENILLVKITGSDFELDEKDKIQLVFKHNNRSIVLEKKIPDRDIGCDFFIGDVFIKK